MAVPVDALALASAPVNSAALAEDDAAPLALSSRLWASLLAWAGREEEL